MNTRRITRRLLLVPIALIVAYGARGAAVVPAGRSQSRPRAGGAGRRRGSRIRHCRVRSKGAGRQDAQRRRRHCRSDRTGQQCRRSFRGFPAAGATQGMSTIVLQAAELLEQRALQLQDQISRFVLQIQEGSDEGAVNGEAASPPRAGSITDERADLLVLDALLSGGRRQRTADIK